MIFDSYNNDYMIRNRNDFRYPSEPNLWVENLKFNVQTALDNIGKNIQTAVDNIEKNIQIIQ